MDKIGIVNIIVNTTVSFVMVVKAVIDMAKLLKYLGIKSLCKIVLICFLFCFCFKVRAASSAGEGLGRGFATSVLLLLEGGTKLDGGGFLKESPAQTGLGLFFGLWSAQRLTRCFGHFCSTLLFVFFHLSCFHLFSPPFFFPLFLSHLWLPLFFCYFLDS